MAAYNNDGELELNLPDITDLSVAHKLNQHWLVSGSISYTNWENFDTLEADIEGAGTVHIKDEYWDGAFRYSVGTEYQLNEKITLRGGLAYDESPVEADYRTLSIPDSDRIWYSAGANFVLNDMVNLDVGYTFIDGEEVKVYETSSVGTTFEGTSEGDANIVSLQLNVNI